MKKTLFSTLIIVFILNISARADVFSKITQNILSKLSVVKGKIIDVKGKKVILNKGYKDGLAKNYFVYIYRDLGKFVPPNSKKPVNLKEGIAYANVTNVFDHKSIAIITQGVEREKKYLIGLGIIPYGEKEIFGKPKIGDKFIAGKSSYTIIIVTRNPYIYEKLKEDLTKTKRFSVIDEDMVQIAIVKNRIRSLYESKAIKKLANILNADLVLDISTTRLNKISYRLFNGYSGYVMQSNSIPIDNKTKIVLKSQPTYNIPPQNIVASNLRLTPKLTFWESLLNKVGMYSPYTGLEMSSPSYKIVFYKNIGYGTTAFYFGNLDGKANEIAIAQGSKVSIYKFGWSSFEKLYSFSFGYNIINIDSAKIGNRTLITISNFDRYGKLSSAIGFIKNHKFIPIKSNMPYHLRFYNKFNNPIIIAQKASVAKPFYGPIYKINLKTFKATKLELPIHPKSFYEFFKINQLIVFLNNSQQLSIYNTEKREITYTTPYGFGGGERLIQRYPIDTSKERSESIDELYRKASVIIPKAIVVEKEKSSFYILGLRNYMSNHITIAKQHYNAYNLKLFKVKNKKPELVWSSGDVKGRVIGCAKNGNYILSVIGVPTGFFSRFIRGIYETDRLTAAKIKY